MLAALKRAYFRHGTLSLYAALDTKTGRVHGRTTARHTSRDFVAFPAEVVSLCSPRQQIHIILDNLSAHKTQPVLTSCNSILACSFTSPLRHSPWLNQVELWFARLNVRSLPVHLHLWILTWLANLLRPDINAVSATACPIQWKYSTLLAALR